MNDDELIERLRGLFPPMPEHVPALGHAAFEWLTPGTTLATLARDTRGTPSGVRGARVRTVTCTAPRVSVEIEVCGREIVGQLAPPVGAEVILRSPHGEHGTRTDEAGGFVLLEVPDGPVSLLFRLADATAVVTSWIHV